MNLIQCAGSYLLKWLQNQPNKGQCRTCKIQHFRNPYSRKYFAKEKMVILREFCLFYMWILFSMCWKFWCLLERHRTVCWHNGLILFDICFNKVGLRLGYFTTSIGLFSHWLCECWFHKRVTVCIWVLWLHS